MKEGHEGRQHLSLQFEEMIACEPLAKKHPSEKHSKHYSEDHPSEKFLSPSYRIRFHRQDMAMVRAIKQSNNRYDPNGRVE